MEMKVSARRLLLREVATIAMWTTQTHVWTLDEAVGVSCIAGHVRRVKTVSSKDSQRCSDFWSTSA